MTSSDQAHGGEQLQHQSLRPEEQLGALAFILRV